MYSALINCLITRVFSVEFVIERGSSKLFFVIADFSGVVFGAGSKDPR
jgi:hypothetical protein